MEDYLLKDLSPDTEVVLSFVLNDKLFEFPLKIIYKKDKNVFLEIIKINNKILGFSNSKIPISLIFYRENNKPLIWERCNIEILRDKDDKHYYKINGDIKGREINRRKDFRVSIGLNIDVKIGTNKKVINGTLYDLSASGFSIIVDKNNDSLNAVNEFVRISFDDINLNYHISLMGKIVRLDDGVVSDNKILCGCHFIKNYPNIGQYLSLKQREYLAKYSNNSSVSGKKMLENEKKIRKVIF